MGIAKARRIERHLTTLLPQDVQPARPLFALSETPPLWGAPLPSGAFTAHAGPTPGNQIVQEATATALARPLLDVASDGQAVQGWIQARAGSCCGCSMRAKARRS